MRSIVFQTWKLFHMVQVSISSLSKLSLNSKSGYEKVSSPKRDLPQSKEKQVITPTLKIEPRSPRIQQLTISPTGGEPKPVTPYQKKTPPSLKRSVTFKDPRQEIEVKQSNRVFPSPRQSQVQIMNQLKKTNKPSEDARFVFLHIFKPWWWLNLIIWIR